MPLEITDHSRICKRSILIAAPVLGAGNRLDREIDVKGVPVPTLRLKGWWDSGRAGGPEGGGGMELAFEVEGLASKICFGTVEAGST